MQFEVPYYEYNSILLTVYRQLKVRVGEWDASAYKGPEQFRHEEYLVPRYAVHRNCFDFYWEPPQAKYYPAPTV